MLTNKVLRAVNPEAFKTVIADLNYLSRKKVSLLKDKDIPITEDALKLLTDFNEDEVFYLGRKLIMPLAQRDCYFQVSAQARQRTDWSGVP